VEAGREPVNIEARRLNTKEPIWRRVTDPEETREKIHWQGMHRDLRNEEMPRLTCGIAAERSHRFWPWSKKGPWGLEIRDLSGESTQGYSTGFATATCSSTMGGLEEWVVVLKC